MKNGRVKFTISKTGVWGLLSMVFMAVSIFLRLGYFWGFWKGVGAQELYTQILLPWAAAISFIILLALFGERNLAATAVPVWLGVAFFVTKATTFVWWHAVLCVILYIAVGVLYSLVVFGKIPTKLPLLPLFGLPLAFHILSDFGVIGEATTQTLRDWLPELSVLCIMLALLLLSVGMKKIVLPDPEPDDQEGAFEN